MCSSFSRSPCIIFDTGMPVARDTTSAISSAPTEVRSRRGLAVLPLALAGFGFLELRFQLRQLAVLDFGHAREVTTTARFIHFELELSICSFTPCEPWAAAFRAALRRSRRIRARVSGFLPPAGARRFFDASSVSFFTASRSIFNWMMRRSSLSITSGLESISILMRLAASSIRSIALSGRKRSVM